MPPKKQDKGEAPPDDAEGGEDGPGPDYEPIDFAGEVVALETIEAAVSGALEQARLNELDALAPAFAAYEMVVNLRIALAWANLDHDNPTELQREVRGALVLAQRRTAASVGLRARRCRSWDRAFGDRCVDRQSCTSTM